MTLNPSPYLIETELSLESPETPDIIRTCACWTGLMDMFGKLLSYC